MQILILNGSIHGEKGNSGAVLKALTKKRKDIDWQVVHLAKTKFSALLVRKIEKADAVLAITGTYWDSWGSPLQKFLEDATDIEARKEVLGKPMGVCVLKHSVGGKSVLSRLQGVFSSMGFMIPPMSGMVYSLSGQLAMRSKNVHAEDFWCMDDLEIIVDNLVIAAKVKPTWKTWPVDRKNFRKKWIQS